MEGLARSSYAVQSGQSQHEDQNLVWGSLSVSQVRETWPKHHNPLPFRKIRGPARSLLSRDQPGAREESSELKAGLSLGPEERRLPVTEMDRGLFNDAEKGFRDSGWERAWPESGPGGQRM